MAVTRDTYTQGSPGPAAYTSGKNADRALGKMEQSRSREIIPRVDIDLRIWRRAQQVCGRNVRVARMTCYKNLVVCLSIACIAPAVIPMSRGEDVGRSVVA